MVRRRKSGLNFGRRKKKINFAVVKEVLSWTVEIALTLLIAFTFVYFIGLRTSVVGQSMSKTLNGGDQILVNRFVYKVTDPKTNDIVVFLPNGNEKSHYYVKRVIGVPGDTGVQRLTGNVAVSVNIPVRQQNTAEPCTSLPRIIQVCLTYRQETQKHGKRNTIEELPWNALISVRKKTIN